MRKRKKKTLVIQALETPTLKFRPSKAEIEYLIKRDEKDLKEREKKLMEKRLNKILTTNYKGQISKASLKRSKNPSFNPDVMPEKEIVAEDKIILEVDD